MRLSVYNENDNTIFSISDAEEKYFKVLNSLFYNYDNTKFYKEYPSRIPYIEKIKKNFLEYGKEMFDQFGYFKKTPWDMCLLEFLKIIEGHNIEWALIGGCALNVRGIDNKTHDVDVMIDPKDIKRIKELFKDFLIEPIMDINNWVVKHFGVAFIHARLDIASDPIEFEHDSDFGKFAMNNLEEVQWNGYTIKVPPIELYLKVNKNRGRQEKVELIEEYLKNQRPL